MLGVARLCVHLWVMLCLRFGVADVVCRLCYRFVVLLIVLCAYVAFVMVWYVGFAWESWVAVNCVLLGCYLCLLCFCLMP